MENISTTQKEVVSLYNKGYTIKEISLKRKTSKNAVYKTLKLLKKLNLLKVIKKGKRRTTPVNEIVYDENCYFCNYDKNIQHHHIIRKTDKGLNEQDNILSVCPNCHSLLHTTYILVYLSNHNMYAMVERRYENDRTKYILPPKLRWNENKVVPLKSLNRALIAGTLYEE